MCEIYSACLICFDFRRFSLSSVLKSCPRTRRLELRRSVETQWHAFAKVDVPGKLAEEKLGLFLMWWSLIHGYMTCMCRMQHGGSFRHNLRSSKIKPKAQNSANARRKLRLAVMAPKEGYIGKVERILQPAVCTSSLKKSLWRTLCLSIPTKQYKIIKP